MLHRCAVLLLALGLDQHHRQIGHLGEVSGAANCRAFGRVKAFVIGPADQLPQELHQGGLTGAGFPHQFEEAIRLLQLTDLLGM
ncbi:hypothetical protein D3C80_1549260 [compost metagenome]